MSLVQTLTPLGANGIYVSPVQEIPRAISITGSVYADQAGTLVIQQGGEILSLVPPSGLAVAPEGTGGTFAAGGYYWVITALNANGETIKSIEASASIVHNGSALLTWTAEPGATGYNIYRGITLGGETYVTTVGVVTTYTDTGTAATGILPPSSPTAFVWDINSTVSVIAHDGEGIDFPLLSPYFQIQYINGSVAQGAFRLFIDARDPYGMFMQEPGDPSPGGAWIVLYFDPNSQTYKVVNRFDGADGFDVNGQAALSQNASGKYASFTIDSATVSQETIQETSVHSPSSFQLDIRFRMSYNSEMKISKDFADLLPSRQATFGDPYTGPIYMLWVYDPMTGHVTIEDNEDKHPAQKHTHTDMCPEVIHPSRINGYAYKIVGGYRLTDDDHKTIEDPYVTKAVLKALKKKYSIKPLPKINSSTEVS